MSTRSGSGARCDGCGGAFRSTGSRGPPRRSLEDVSFVEDEDYAAGLASLLLEAYSVLTASRELRQSEELM
jgi:hypothetical protein